MTQKLESIQALRAVAANLVLLSHLCIFEHRFGGGEALLPMWFIQGRGGVDLFFVISGFIMVAVAGRGTTPGHFLWNRASRVFPAYWFYTTVVLAVAFVLPGLVNSSIGQPISIWRSYLLLPQRTDPLLAVGWTLVYEMYFYVAFALLLLGKIDLRRGLIVWAAVVLVGAAIYSLLSGDPRRWPTLHVVLSPLTLEFIMGAGVALLVERTRRRGGYALAIGVMLFLAGLLLHESQWQRVWLLGIPAAMIVYGAVCLERAGKLRLPRILVALGDASYSTYLAHVLVIALIARTIDWFALTGWIDNVIIVVASVLGANAAGWISSRAIERPSLALLRPARSRRARYATSQAS